MTETYRGKKRTAFLASALSVLALCALTAVWADYYYDLNDDVLIKDITSGVLTGTPTGYNIQMLYPIGALLALLYRMAGGIPWYGLFLCGCQWGSLFLISRRVGMLCLESRRWETASVPGWVRTLSGAAASCACCVLSAALLGRELVYVQYTVTAALLAGSAVFLFVTRKTEDGAFFAGCLPPFLLLLLAFWVRSELLLLLLPFAGAGWVICLFRELRGTGRGAETDGRAAALRYAAFAAALAAALGGSVLAHEAAYGSREWQEFLDFFDARTQLYDFYGIPDYASHRDFYESLHISEAEWALLDNYNFGFWPSLDAARMQQLAAYARDCYHEAHPLRERLREALWQYGHRLLPLPGDTIGAFRTDMPWNVLLLLCYGQLLLTGVLHKKGEPFLLLLLTGAARSVSWGYVLLRGRLPERISVSLYAAELLLLLAALLTIREKRRPQMQESRVLREQELRRRLFRRQETARRLRQAACLVLPALAVLTAAVSLPGTAARIREEQGERLRQNAALDALQAYCSASPDRYYYVDVRSTTRFSEKIFRENGEKQAAPARNYDIIGGWACKSPLTAGRTPEWFAIRRGGDVSWLEALLAERGDGTCLEPEEGAPDGGSRTDETPRLEETGGGTFPWDVYRLVREPEPDGQEQQAAQAEEGGSNGWAC